MEEPNKTIPSKEKLSIAVQIIKDAILQSQQRALGAVNQEQLALYHGVGRYISANTRTKNWGVLQIRINFDKSNKSNKFFPNKG